MTVPTPTQIKKARKDAGLFQREAAALIGRTDRAWRRYESGATSMSVAEWELFLIKIRPTESTTAP